MLAVIWGQQRHGESRDCQEEGKLPLPVTEVGSGPDMASEAATQGGTEEVMGT